MLITEYRIPLPLTTEEYRIGQLFTTMEMSNNETGGGEGVEILCNEPTTNTNTSFDLTEKGQYTYKIYHMAKKLPTFIRNMASENALEFHEESWNFFPFCKTEIKKLNCLDDGFSISIQTHHINDKGNQDNVHNLSDDLLKKRSVVYLDVVNDMTVKSEYDPAKFKSVKTGRGPFGVNWIETAQPIMTCYKLVTSEFKWFGLQPRVENLIQLTEKRLFFLFNRMVICSMDKWHGLTIDDIRGIEKQGGRDLHKKLFKGDVQGMVVTE